MEKLTDNIAVAQDAIDSQPTLKSIYEDIIGVIGSYMDMEEDDIRVVALWILGANSVSMFTTYPFLYFNASKGSGKTRLLNLMKHIIPRSEITPNLSESSLFRMPQARKLNALMIDEAERLWSKDKANLKELLNTVYKKGGKVFRVGKDKNGVMNIEEFSPFFAVAMANIWGLEGVLEDRCISLILEKSNNSEKVNLPELFDFDPRIKKILNELLVYDVNVGLAISHNLGQLFTKLLPPTSPLLTLYTPHTQPSYPTQHTPLFNVDIEEFLSFLKSGKINGREMELWLPLLLIAALVSREVFLDVLRISVKKCTEKRTSEMSDDRDFGLASFIYYMLESEGHNYENWISINKIRSTHEEAEGKKDWFSNEWIGHALKRMNIISQKRRINKGFEVAISKEKLERYITRRGVALDQIFKTPDENKETGNEKIRDWIDDATEETS